MNPELNPQPRGRARPVATLLSLEPNQTLLVEVVKVLEGEMRVALAVYVPPPVAQALA